MHQIRFKSTTKLQATNFVSVNSPSAPGPSLPANPPPKPKPASSPHLACAHNPKSLSGTPIVYPVPPKKARPLPPQLDLQSWEHETLSGVFKVTLQVSEILYPALSSNSELPCNLE